MRYKKLGRTGLLVSEMSLGTMTFGGNGTWSAIGALKQAQATELVERALSAGVNLIDTANVYSNGEAERMLGQALKDLDVPREESLLLQRSLDKWGRDRRWRIRTKTHH